MKRNDDSSPANDKRNGSMTNAERQKRYRDKKRGGPPKGRWAGHLTVAEIAQRAGVSRTKIFMCSWIKKNAPEYFDGIKDGEIKIGPLYRQLKDEYDAGIFKAVCERPSGNNRLVCRRVDGAFEFEWIPEGDDGRNQ